MMLLWSKILFVVTFLGQIWLISHYYPNRLRARMKEVLTRYPPAEYPRLYPKPVEYYKIGQWGFLVTTRLVLGLGFLFLVGALTVDNGTFSEDGYISEIWPAVYGMIQFVPLVLLEISEYRNFKQMREANTAKRRSAELRPRRLRDYVSTGLVATALGALVLALVVDLVATDFDLTWGSDTVSRGLVLIAFNLAIVLGASRAIYGRKIDPHQAESDRARRLRLGLSSMLLVSIAMSVFNLVQIADQVFDLDFLDAAMISLYFQAMVMLTIGHVLRGYRLEEIDFEVYRAAPPTAAAPMNGQ